MNFLTGGYVIAAAFAIAYGGWLTWQQPSRLRTIVKTLSIGSLALLSYRLNGPILLTTALGLSAVGDAFLANKGDRNFLFGLGSFLLAHISYTALFLSSGISDMENISLYKIAVSAILIITGFYIFRKLWPYLAEMRVPVLCYICAILAMGISAIITQDHSWILAGAALFIASDVILSHELFVWDKNAPIRRHSPYLIWGLYWSGQAMIAWVFLSAL